MRLVVDANILIDDVPYLALALFLDIPIWSNDGDFKEQSLVKVYTTTELLQTLKVE